MTRILTFLVLAPRTGETGAAPACAALATTWIYRTSAWEIASSLGIVSLAERPPRWADHTRVKQRIFMAYREQGPCRARPVYYLLNMDAQDRQDKQHQTLRHRKQIRSMIRWVLEVIQEPGSGFWEIRVGTEAMVERKTVETLAK